MMKSGTIFGNPVRLFLSSRSEMQSVIAQARAKTTTNPSQFQMESSSIAESNGANPIKYPTPNVLSSMISNFQPKSNQTSFDANINQNGTSIQQIFAALNEKSSTQGQTFPFQLPTLNNPLQTFNNSLNPQVIDERKIFDIDRDSNEFENKSFVYCSSDRLLSRSLHFIDQRTKIQLI